MIGTGDTLAARTAALSAASGHAEGSQTREGRTLEIDVEGVANGSNQTVFITTDKGTAEVLTVGDKYWLGGDKAFWVEQTGDAAAAGPLWEAYFARLVAVARGRLRAAPRAAADEEDVALSAFDSFCRGVEGGRFPRLGDRDDLWQVLFVITDRRALILRSGWVRKKKSADSTYYAEMDKELEVLPIRGHVGHLNFASGVSTRSPDADYTGRYGFRCVKNAEKVRDLLASAIAKYA